MARTVILGRDAREAAPEPTSPTLDALFRRAAAKRPDALALADPPNRADIVGGVPRRLTYAQADRAIAAMAAQLRALGLHGDDLVGLQMPNTVESLLALLAIGRAGLIAVSMPLLWRRADAATALRRLGVKALIAGTHAGATDHASLAMTIAAEVFPIKHVLGFGASLPDGMIALDETGGDTIAAEVSYDRGEHVAVVTWDVAPDGLVPVARSHAGLIAGGIADIRAFGEIGFIAARRDADGKPARTASDGIETKQTGAGTIALRGTMVPQHPFPPNSENLPLPSIQATTDGFVDTGYTCRRDAASDELVVTGPPPGLVHVGGYRFAALALQDAVIKAEPRASIAALPDALAGHRLAGAAPDAPALQQALEESGLNPLISGAFTPRRKAG